MDGGRFDTETGIMVYLTIVRGDICIFLQSPLFIVRVATGIAKRGCTGGA